jgi:tetratricopeptide (TPR) repeat protein
VARLPPVASETLRIAATIGAEFELGLLERLVAGREQAVAALDAALAAGLVVEAADVAGRFAFVHALAREAIHESMSATRRASLHQRVGDALESGEPVAASALAHHFLEARHLAGADRAVQWTLVAAEQAAAAFAWEDEVAHYETALRVLDEIDSPDDATRCRMLLRLADRLVSLGRQFKPVCLRAAELARRHGWTDALAAAAHTIARGVPDADVMALLEEALATLGDHDSPWRARLLGRLADNLVLDGREPERADVLSREGLEMARRLDDPVALIAALDSRSLALAGPQHLDERIRLTSEALALADDAPNPAWTHNLRRELIVLRTEVGDLRGARADLDALAESMAEERLHGTLREADVLRLRAAHAVIDGRLEEAGRQARAGEALRERLGQPDPANASIALALSTRLERDGGAELADAVAQRASCSPVYSPWRAAQCLLHAEAGRDAEAHVELRVLTEHDCASIPRLHDWLPTLAMLADACAELADPAAAGALQRLLAPYANRVAVLFSGTAPLGPIARPLGRLAALRGRLDDAVTLLERALNISQAITAPIWVAHAQADLSAALTQRCAPGDTERAHTRVSEPGLLGLARHTEHARGAER